MTVCEPRLAPETRQDPRQDARATPAPAPKTLSRVRWALARFLFLALGASAILSGGLLPCLLSPLYAWYFFRDWNGFRYYRYWLPLIRGGCRQIGKWLWNPEYRGMFRLPLTAPPRLAPEAAQFRLRPDWPGTENGCQGCVQCCLTFDCPLLEAGTGRCRSYGSFYWRYFNCGRYPQSEAQLRYYACPKWAWVPDGTPCTIRI